jgi:hypothetical protein
MIVEAIRIRKRKSRIREYPAFIMRRGGNDLLSHAVTHAVPSALRSLTTVFGMGTGVASSLEPPPQGEVLGDRIGVRFWIQSVALLEHGQASRPIRIG